MSINKIIHLYFAFIMTMTSVAGLSYYSEDVNDFLGDSYASVVHTFDAALVEPIEEEAQFEAVELELGKKSELLVELFGGNYAKAGEKGVEVMDIFLKTENLVQLEEMNLMVGDGVEALYLSDRGEYWEEADWDGEKWTFDTLDLSVEGEMKLLILADVSKELVPGKRLRFDLVDLGEIDSKLPLGGKYVTIVR